MENNKKNNILVAVVSIIITVLFLMATGGSIKGFLIASCWMAFYLIPTVVASIRKHRSGKAIFVLNILLGWTVLGWIASLVWSLTGDIKNKEGKL